jgi:uncharacterized membrane protein YpjA
MVLDPFVFVILLIVIYWVLDDVIGLFLYASVLMGVFMKLSSFVSVPDELTELFYFIVSLVAFASIGKFFFIINKRKSALPVVR